MFGVVRRPIIDWPYVCLALMVQDDIQDWALTLSFKINGLKHLYTFDAVVSSLHHTLTWHVQPETNQVDHARILGPSSKTGKEKNCLFNRLKLPYTLTCVQS